MLHNIDLAGYSKKKRWCGPGAIATLTGISLRDATELLVSVMQDQTYDKLSGVYHEHMMVALGSLGYSMKQCLEFNDRYSNLIQGPSLRRYMNERPIKEKATMVLIDLGDHYVSAHLNYICDNWTLKPVHIDKFPKPGRRISNIFFIEKLPYR